jgi:cyclomaltodextrinase
MKRTLRLGLLALTSLAFAHAQGMSFGLEKARSSPEWLSRATIYQVWMRAFTPECTLKAVTARLPYIANLGASIVYMSPLYPGWNPYGIDDYDAIDPRYGTEADLKALIESAHKLGLKVIMDIVFSQTGPENALQKRSGFYRTIKDGRLEVSWWKWPIPDFTKPQVREYFVGNLLHWVRDVKADGFRCDVADAVPLEFWEQARDALDKVNPEVVILAEGDRPDDQLKAFDLNYNYAYYTTLRSVMRDGEKASRIREQWESARSTYPRGARLLHFNDNHDQTRAVLQFGLKGALAASVLNFMLDGVPFLYNGQEIADSTATPWYETKAIAFPSSHQKLDPRIADLMFAMGMKDERMPTLETYKRLFQLRKEEAALTSGELLWINNTASDSVLSFLRKRSDDEVLVIVNLSNRSLIGSLDLRAADYLRLQKLFGNGALGTDLERLVAGRVGFSLPAYATVIAKRSPPLTK